MWLISSVTLRSSMRPNPGPDQPVLITRAVITLALITRAVITLALIHVIPASHGDQREQRQ